MNTYLFLGKYTATGRAGLIKEGGSAREKVTVELFEKILGGKLRNYAFCEGEYDFIVHVDLPDDKAKNAVSLLTTSGGTIEVTSLKLLTPAYIDEVAKLARDVAFREPGKS